MLDPSGGDIVERQFASVDPPGALGRQTLDLVQQSCQSPIQPVAPLRCVPRVLHTGGGAAGVPQHHVVDDVVAKLVGGSCGCGASVVTVGVAGRSGAGKTAAALQAFNHVEVVRVFEQRRYWLTLGDVPPLWSLLIDLASDMSAIDPSQRDAAVVNPLATLDALLRHHVTGVSGCGKVLVVLDDVCKEEHARQFLLHRHHDATVRAYWERAGGVSFLMTSQSRGVLKRLGADVYDVRVAPTTRSISGSVDTSLDHFWWLCGGLGAPDDESKEAARHVCMQLCGGIPLAQQIVADIVRGALQTRTVSESLRGFMLTDGGRAGRPPTPVRDCLQLSLRELGDTMQRRYRQLAVFGKNVVVSSNVLAVLWGVTREDAVDVCHVLLDRHLLSRAELPSTVVPAQLQSSSVPVLRVLLHDLLRDVLVGEADNLGELHESLLLSLSRTGSGEYRDSGGLDVSSTSGSLSGVDWSVFARVDDGDDIKAYVRQHLSYHLSSIYELSTGAGTDALARVADARLALVRRVALSAAWLVGRCVCDWYCSTIGAQDDVRIAMALVESDSEGSGVGRNGKSAAELLVLRSVLESLREYAARGRIGGDIGRCASYFWASLRRKQQGWNHWDADGSALHLLGDMVSQMSECRGEYRRSGRRSSCTAVLEDVLVFLWRGQWQRDLGQFKSLISEKNWSGIVAFLVDLHLHYFAFRYLKVCDCGTRVD